MRVLAATWEEITKQTPEKNLRIRDLKINDFILGRNTEGK